MTKTIKLENGETLEIKPIPFGKLSYFSDVIAGIIHKVANSGGSLETTEDFTALLQTATEEVILLMSKVIDKPREWFDTISIADGFAILNTIIDLNVTEEAKKNFSLVTGWLGRLLPKLSVT